VRDTLSTLTSRVPLAALSSAGSGFTLSALVAVRARGMTVHKGALSAKVTGMFRLSSAVMVDE
jgi:hypothetical protein